VNPETLTDVEGGIKTDLLDEALRINLSGFHYNWKQLQVSVVEATPTGAFTSLQNAASAEIYGGELSMNASLSKELSLNSGIAWTPYSKYKNFTDAAGYGPAAFGNSSIVENATGWRLQRSPELVYTGGLTEQHELSNGGKISFRGDVYYNSGYYWDPVHSQRQTEYKLLNLSSGYTFPGRNLEISAWVTNLTNSYINQGTIATALGRDVSDAPPRMYGLSFKWTL
jgi:iron complex outermembrane receptor protein